MGAGYALSPRGHGDLHDPHSSLSQDVYKRQTQTLDLVWNLSDIANALMAIPNLISMLILAPVSYTHLDVYKRQLQTDAATITPAAKPVSPRCTERFISPRIKNTHAAPRDCLLYTSEKMKKEHEFSGFRTEKTMERAEQLEDAMGQADKDVSGETEVETVSYTHLDVYKRQFISLSRRRVVRF